MHCNVMGWRDYFQNLLNSRSINSDKCQEKITIVLDVSINSLFMGRHSSSLTSETLALVEPFIPQFCTFLSKCPGSDVKKHKCKLCIQNSLAIGSEHGVCHRTEIGLLVLYCDGHVQKTNFAVTKK